MTTRMLTRLGVLAGFVATTFAAGRDELRGDQVGWARLKTSSPHWRGHATSDPKLMTFLREQTTLNLDPTWHFADIEQLAEMCRYPLLFSQGVQTVDAPEAQKNLAEYVRRGGFLLIDACINPHLRGEPGAYLAGQQRTLAQVLPEARIVPLANDHPIYRSFFAIGGGPPHTEEGFGWGEPGLVGIFIGSRLAGVISRSGLQCGWAGLKREPGHDVASMRMLVNIYIYAMMNAG